MSLKRLYLSLQRLVPPAKGDPTFLADLESLFLTSRQCSEKYQRLIPEVLNTGYPDEPNDFEQGMMWFAFKNDKPPDESIFGDNEEEKEEKWKKDWLDRMERRESVHLAQISLRHIDNFQEYRFRSSCIYSGCVTPYPTLSLSLPSARPLLPRSENNGTSHRHSRLMIGSNL